MGTIDDTEEITILMELCDLVANSFSSQADPNDQRAEEWTTDTHHPQTLTVASCLEAEASLQGTLEKLEQMKEERLASSPQYNSLVQNHLANAFTTVRDSCLQIILGLKASFVCDSILETMQHLRLTPDEPIHVNFTYMRTCARQRLRSGLMDVVNKVKDITEQLKSLPGRLPDSFDEELSNLQTTISTIDINMSTNVA
ncbi:uncharacterized protein LOC112569264 [Pomacea canaliculata]|nr:uncharacterized protein LOC112569264 [Pomacea canaliculata]